MKKILILFLALFLVAGGGRDVVAESAKKKASLDGEHIYLRLDPITATIFRNDQPAGTFTAAVTLEIVDESVRTDIVEVRRRLRDSMFRELHAMFEREEYTGRKVDVDAVKRRMLVVSRRELGEDVVLDVFVNTLMRKGA